MFEDDKKAFNALKDSFLRNLKAKKDVSNKNLFDLQFPQTKSSGKLAGADAYSGPFQAGKKIVDKNSIGDSKSLGKDGSQSGLNTDERRKKLGTFTGPDGNTRTIYPDDTGSKNSAMPTAMVGAPGTGSTQGQRFGSPRPSLFETRMQNQLAWTTNQLSTGGGQNLDWRTPMGRQNIARRSNLRDVHKQLVDLLNGQADARTPAGGLAFGQRSQLKDQDLNNALIQSSYEHKKTLERDRLLEQGKSDRIKLSSSAKQAVTMAQERSRAIRARLAAGESIPPEELTMALMQIDNIGSELDTLFDEQANGQTSTGSGSSNPLDPRSY